MKINLSTTFGVSTSFYSSDTLRFQGEVQGNGAAPALWFIISIFLIRYLHHRKVVSSLSSPISNITQFLVALMHVDDTDLHVFNEDFVDSATLVKKAQQLLDSWHEALHFTGGDLKVSKCYWTLQDYHWTNRKCT